MDNTVPLGKISDVILLFRTGLLLGSEAEQAPPLIQVKLSSCKNKWAVFLCQTFPLCSSDDVLDTYSTKVI
jgi:hypothetical protein